DREGGHHGDPLRPVDHDSVILRRSEGVSRRTAVMGASAGHGRPHPPALPRTARRRPRRPVVERGAATGDRLSGAARATPSRLARAPWRVARAEVVLTSNRFASAAVSGDVTLGAGGFPMSATQSEKAMRFRALHEAPGVFVIPNPWDAGSARILAGLGFQALATSSGASAGVLGRRDGSVTRDEALAHARAIVEASDLPVSCDLEKGFGDAPSVVAETIRMTAGVGAVGGSIEDATGD